MALYVVLAISLYLLKMEMSPGKFTPMPGVVLSCIASAASARCVYPAI